MMLISIIFHTLYIIQFYLVRPANHLPFNLIRCRHLKDFIAGFFVLRTTIDISQKAIFVGGLMKV